MVRAIDADALPNPDELLDLDVVKRDCDEQIRFFQ